jgi:uncharacterized protein (UPF0335 family)
MAEGDFPGIVNAEQLRGYCGRRCNLLEDRDRINEDIRELDQEIKDAGFDRSTVREIVREMRTDPEARNARYTLLDSYRQSLGLYGDTPLGQAAMERAAEEAAPRRRRRRKTDLEEIEPAGVA